MHATFRNFFFYTRRTIEDAWNFLYRNEPSNFEVAEEPPAIPKP